MAPAAPVKSSTMMVWPSALPIGRARPRDTPSAAPPAANGQTIVIGRDGNVSAAATCASAGSAAAPAVSCRNCLRAMLICFLRSFKPAFCRVLSFRFEVRELHHLGPLLGIRDDEFFELGRRIRRHDQHAESEEMRLD